jgi:4-hydroxybutyryl-CoA dehydratase/vinylacetyl-CoA-Delta-isomerase
MDAFNAVFNTTFEIDQKHGTNYHERFTKYMEYVQDNDLAVDGCMTDARGERSKTPGEQPDPDAYLHVVERRPDGIVIRGCKLHQTGMINSHEILVIEQFSLKENKGMGCMLSSTLDAPVMIMFKDRQHVTLETEDGGIDKATCISLDKKS